MKIAARQFVFLHFWYLGTAKVKRKLAENLENSSKTASFPTFFIGWQQKNSRFRNFQKFLKKIWKISEKNLKKILKKWKKSEKCRNAFGARFLSETLSATGKISEILSRNISEIFQKLIKMIQYLSRLGRKSQTYVNVFARKKPVPCLFLLHLKVVPPFIAHSRTLMDFPKQLAWMSKETLNDHPCIMEVDCLCFGVDLHQPLIKTYSL